MSKNEGSSNNGSDNGMILEKRKDMYAGDPRSLVIIGLDTDDGPSHPLWDERIKYELKPEFVANIGFLGVQEPITVIREKLDETDEGGKAKSRYVVVDGRQRVRAARLVNEKRTAAGEPLSEIAYVVKKVSETGQVDLMLALNEHRRGDDPLTKCEKCLRALNAGVDKLNIANDMGITPLTLGKYLSIAADCTRKVKDALRAEQIGIGQAYTLSALSKAKQDSTLASILADAQPSKKEESNQNEGDENEGSEENGSEGNAQEPAPKERKKNERFGVSIVELRKALDSKASAVLSDEAFAILSWMVGANVKDEAGTADLLNSFMEKAKIEAAKPKPRGRPKKAAVEAVEPEAATEAPSIVGTLIPTLVDDSENDAEFSGHVDSRLLDGTFEEEDPESDGYSDEKEEEEEEGDGY